MTLYSVYHGMSLKHAIVHRLTESKEEEAYILISREVWHIGNQMDCERLLQIFDKVLYCQANVGFQSETSVEDIEKKIVMHYDFIFKTYNIELNKLKKVYNLLDFTDSFGLYLTLKRKKYFQLEEFKKLL